MALHDARHGVNIWQTNGMTPCVKLTVFFVLLNIINNHERRILPNDIV